MKSQTRKIASPLLFFAGLVFAGTDTPVCGAETRYASHRPTRPLPAASSRPLTGDSLRYVDGQKGDDTAAGIKEAPWRTIQHAVRQLRPGDTLVLRGGTYFENVKVTASGTAERPIVIRAHPGELVTLDGGIPAFQTNPAAAWEPCPGGAEGEYRSTEAYPNLGGREGDTNLLGNFGDSLVPLHGYRFLGDLRSDNPYWNISSKVADEQHVSCGPGLWYDVESGRIHVRLVRTKLPALGQDNYRGEIDPRKIPLIIAGHASGPVITLDGVQHVRLEDLVLRGARDATLDIRGSARIELDGLTVYGGSSPIRVVDTHGLRMQHTACRGLAAPWTFRGSLKYRAIESRLFSSGGWEPSGADSRDFEIAGCEFTDSVDGVFIGNVSKVRFHHNLLDNVSDDGIFLTANTTYDGETPGGDVHIYQNLLSRCLTTFAFGVGHGRQKFVAEGTRQTGAGVFVYRNVFDFRRPVMYHWPSGPDDVEITSLGRVAGDHGSPAWEPMWIYHNTILAGDPPRYDYGTDGLGRAVVRGTTRRVFNNIICQLHGLPGQSLPEPKADFQADGNLFWSLSEGADFQGEWFARFRNSPAFAESKKHYAPGWTHHDRFADPNFVRVPQDWREAPDLRLADSSPAIDRGVTLPKDWPDPLRDEDSADPDAGALPRGAEPWRVGAGGRLTVFGEDAHEDRAVSLVSAPFEAMQTAKPETSKLRAVIIEGYPAFDAPLIAYGLRKRGVNAERLERTWLNPKEFRRHDLVIIDGSFTRAKIVPDRFSEEDIPVVRQFLEDGGTLLLMRERTDLFGSAPGQRFLVDIGALGPRENEPELSVQMPDHPWVRHLKQKTPEWLSGRKASPLRASRGEVVLGSPRGSAALYRVPVGRGQLIYVAWSPAASLPSGRKVASVAEETSYEEQARILWNLLDDLTGSAH